MDEDTKMNLIWGTVAVVIALTIGFCTCFIIEQVQQTTQTALQNGYIEKLEGSSYVWTLPE